MIFNIDLDRGVHVRTDPATGADVYMYVDEPGVYRSAHGGIVDVELARRAGFPVEEHLKQKRVREALKTAQDKVLAELQAADGREKVNVLEKGGFKVIDISYGRYNVVSPDDDQINPTPLNLRAAIILLDELNPETPKTTDKQLEEIEAKARATV